ncbi:glycosyltransferase [Prescottella equi]|uniref:glycosyltransferase n=1 Tax=Rhodococcus hoagii TaxID=43767 RepID=UPI001F5B22AF|nr:glycosyltransferase [Prescottella equi]UNQ39114.1 glycosyltransferase [Prescottella equi]
MDGTENWPDAIADGQRLLVAASTGGHLDEMVRLSDSLGMAKDSMWVTFDTPQSRSILSGKPTHFLDYISPRDARAVAKGASSIFRLLQNDDGFDGAVSTGAAIALSVLPVARYFNLPAIYIESSCRFDSPSLTGRIMERLPGIVCLSPGAPWTKRWKHGPSLLGRYEVQRANPEFNPKLFVSLGTIRPYRFDSLIDAVCATGMVDERTIWQVGATQRVDLPGTVVPEMSVEAFEHHIDDCDAVITHAGIGNVLRIIERGKFPIVVPRRKSQGEHVDDHQLELCKAVIQGGIGLVCEPRELTAESIISATSRKIVRKT